MFTDFQDLYSFFSSTRLSSLVNQTNKKFREMYRSKIIPRPTVDQTKQQVNSVSEPGFMIFFYKEAKLYLESDEIQQDNDDDDDSKVIDTTTQGEMLHTFASTCLNFPYIPLYKDFADSMNNAIEHAMLKSFDDANTLSLLREFDSLLMDYAEKLSDIYDGSFYELTSPLAVNNYLNEDCWDVNEHSTLQYLDTNEIEDSDFAPINKLIAYANSAQLPDAVIKFMLNPIIGTAGLAINRPTCSPIYTTVFPPMYLQRHAKTIWDYRASTMSPKPLPPSKQADTYQSHCENVFLDKIRKQTIHSTFHDKVNGSKTPQGDEDNSNPGLSFSSTGQSSHGKGSSGSGNGPSSGGPSSHAPLVPDDSSYEPDPSLARLVRESTEAIKKQTKSDMNHDHMTRFTSTTESPTPVSKAFIRRGNPNDFDLVVTSRVLGKDYLYVVTYTRKSKKPIFNPVN